MSGNNNKKDDAVNNAPKRTRKDSEISSDEVTPKSGSSTRFSLLLLDKRLEKQAEHITSKIMESMKVTMETLALKIDRVFSDMDDVVARVTRLEGAVSVCEPLRSEMDTLKAAVEKQKNSVVACDILLHGIPQQLGEDLRSIFGNICKSINYPVPAVFDVRRLKTNKPILNNTDQPVLIKLSTAFERNNLLVAASEFRKNNNNSKPLMLKHAGLPSEAPIYLNESLTSYNHNIMKAAIRLKKEKQLVAVFSRRGLVYAKCKLTDVPVCIDSMEKLNQMIVGTLPRNKNPTASISISDPSGFRDQ